MARFPFLWLSNIPCVDVPHLQNVLGPLRNNWESKRVIYIPLAPFQYMAPCPKQTHTHIHIHWKWPINTAGQIVDFLSLENRKVAKHHFKKSKWIFLFFTAEKKAISLYPKTLSWKSLHNLPSFYISMALCIFNLNHVI